MLAMVAAADSASTVRKKYSIFIYSEAEPHAMYVIYIDAYIVCSTVVINVFNFTFLRSKMKIKFNIFTHIHPERPKQAWQCWKYFTYKHFSDREMVIRCHTPTLLKIFCELSLYCQVFFKNMRVADYNF